MIWCPIIAADEYDEKTGRCFAGCAGATSFGLCSIACGILIQVYNGAKYPWAIWVGIIIGILTLGLGVTLFFIGRRRRYRKPLNYY